MVVLGGGGLLLLSEVSLYGSRGVVLCGVEGVAKERALLLVLRTSLIRNNPPS